MSAGLPGAAAVTRTDPARPPLVGIARRAAGSTRLAAKQHAEYFSLACGSLLNRCPNPQLPFQWTINPYRGCEFGCKYCYARYTHEFMGLDRPQEFEEKIYSKAQAADVLRRELRRDPGGAIAIGTATDPYQPAERMYRTTRSILETIAEFRGLELSITTKSDLVTRDIVLLQKISAVNSLQVNVTITTLDRGLARKLEPLAPRPDLRLAAVHALSNAGISVAVFAMPVLPGLTDTTQNLEAIARAAAAAGARSFAASVLFLMPSAQRAFFPFIEQEFPHLTERYRKLYRRNAYLRAPYAGRIQALAQALRRRHFPQQSPPRALLPPFGRCDQLTLFH